MANVLSQAKDLYKMQKEAREMQNNMKKIIVEGESKGGQVKVRINGINEVEDIEISDELLSPDTSRKLSKLIVEAFKDANKKLQKELMKGMDLSRMKSMLGV